MDRRHFMNMFLAAPALAPLLLAAKQTSHSGELYLISDEPQKYLPSLLAASAPFQAAKDQTFAFITPHPREQRLCASLELQGWKAEADPSLAYLTLSFSLLRHASRPSFTFVQEGHIKDVRSRKLRSLWDLMGQSSKSSSSLTTAGFRADPPVHAQGKFVAVFQDGKLKAKIPLNRTERRTWQTLAGSLIVQVDQGRAKIVQAPCRHQICRCTPPVSLSGERIICAPSHFFLEIQGSSGLDTVIG